MGETRNNADLEFSVRELWAVLLMVRMLLIRKIIKLRWAQWLLLIRVSRQLPTFTEFPSFLSLVDKTVHSQWRPLHGVQLSRMQCRMWVCVFAANNRASYDGR